MIIHMNLGEDSYDIVVERGVIAKASKHLNLDRRVLVVTDSGVPAEYAKLIAEQCKDGVIYTVEAGEASKSLEVFEKLLGVMLECGFSRKDCVVAVGGGVVGDLSGFAASAYMRGIDFYNIPTTLLSQIDSSIGGKTAINFGGVKNIVGAFYQPKSVLIDPELLKTLPARQISNGLAEALKMALTSDKELFDIFENKNIEDNIDEIIIRSLNIKKNVVEQDEKESGLRKILNFGHTIGHGIESSEEMSKLYHGECVALGMIPMCDETIRPRLIEVLKKCGLYRTLEYDWEKITKAAFHDKKADGNTVTVTTVSKVGSFEMKKMSCLDVIEMAKSCLEDMKEYSCVGNNSAHSFSKGNIVLTGMPGSGKSTVGKLINIDGYEFIDTDEQIEKRCGCTIKELIAVKGETYFRDLESEVIRDVSSESCRVISVGGGAVLREENVKYLKRNGKLFFINADIKRLRATDDRPLSDTYEKLAKLYSERMSIYQSTADVIVPDMGTSEAEAQYIMKKRMEMIW